MCSVKQFFISGRFVQERRSIRVTLYKGGTIYGPSNVRASKALANDVLGRLRLRVLQKARGTQLHYLEHRSQKPRQRRRSRASPTPPARREVVRDPGDSAHAHAERRARVGPGAPAEAREQARALHPEEAGAALEVRGREHRLRESERG